MYRIPLSLGVTFGPRWRLRHNTAILYQPLPTLASASSNSDCHPNAGAVRVAGSFCNPSGQPPSATSDSPAGLLRAIRGLLPQVLPLSRFCEKITSLAYTPK
jgi:hypothetical protein